MRSGWWTGTRLVTGRGIRESLAARSFRVTVILLLVASAGGIILWQVLGGGPTRYTLATVQAVDPAVRTQLDTAAQQGTFDVAYTQLADVAAVQKAVGNGDADVGLVDRTVYTSSGGSSTFVMLVTQAVSGAQSVERLHQLGLSDADIAGLAEASAVAQVPVEHATDTARFGVGMAVGILLYLIVFFAGMSVATTIGTEKSSRISEVLLSVLRPSQVLVGNVVAVTVTLGLLALAAAVPALVALPQLGVRVPSVLGSDLALAAVWLLLGFTLYSFAFAAAGALVDKVTEVSAATSPITMVVVIGYVLSVSVIPQAPSGAVSVVLSLFPLSAPMAMPIRWATGQVPVWQLALALALMVLATAVVVRLATVVYRRAITRTGGRLRWRQVLGAGDGVTGQRRGRARSGPVHTR